MQINTGNPQPAAARVARAPQSPAGSLEVRDQVSISDHVIRGGVGMLGFVASAALGVGLVAGLDAVSSGLARVLLVPTVFASLAALGFGCDEGGQAVTRCLGRLGARAASAMGGNLQSGAQILKGLVAVGVVAGFATAGAVVGVGAPVTGALLVLSILGCGAGLSRSLEADRFTS
ncbi:MAG: hypothetical protein AB1758_18145 [Candidatus Eremiobacterota bacterium]